MLDHQFKEFRTKAEVADNYVPVISTDLGTAIFPSAFGCDVVWLEDTFPWARPRIFDNPRDAEVLKGPSVTAGLLGRVLDYTDFFNAKVGMNYPIRVTDIQGPLDVAYLIWNNEDIMMAMYSGSKEVHSLLRKITDLIIAFVKEQRKHVREFVPIHFPRIWMPDGFGIAISEDISAVIGPKLYAEYSLPYMIELSEEFGGLFIHSCGNFAHNLENMSKIPNLRGLDFGVTEVPLVEIIRYFDGKALLTPRVGLNKDIEFSDFLEYAKYIHTLKKDPRGLLIQIDLATTPTGKKLIWDDDYREQILQLFSA
ncbi:MAG: hypothetical protein HPY71_05815 [Firmicutes bacterium]|nr:hypothetical protein [Bacillota bacterium]